MTLTRLILLAALLAWGVMALGAYVRLSGAGLGCPDWPGCYGHLGAPSGAAQQQAALAAFPGRPLEPPKAWKEMIHRYAAGALGLLILAIAIKAWRERHPARRMAAVLLGLLLFQALLGRWTVTELLHPAIVTAHLLGGMATLAVLVWLGLTAREFWPRRAANPSPHLWAVSGLALLAAQIALGGWTSAHYAALACGSELTCRGEWIPALDFAGAFSLAGERIATADTLTTIHWSHRLGALLLAGVLAPLALRLRRDTRWRGFGTLLLALLALQIALGIANVALDLPLATAVLHNAVAALLLAALVTLNRILHQERNPS